MQANELCFGMPPHHAPARFLELHVAWEVFAMEGPIGVRVQLFPALVESVYRQEERLRIRDMHRHRHLHRAGRFPHGIEAPVVNRNQLPCLDVLP